MSGGWAGHRGGYDDTQWKRLRHKILKRDGGRCQWPTNGVRCLQYGNNVDHIVNRAGGGTDDEHNLWTLCIQHHLIKTAKEGATARHRFREKRAPEAHPGLC